jgi:hypothetical protein
VKGLVGPKGWETVIRPYVPEAVYRRLLRNQIRWQTPSGGAESASD